MTVRTKTQRLLRMGLGAGLRHAAAKFLLGPIFGAFEHVGLHVLPIHFYSPVPDTRDLRRRRAQWDRDGSMAGVDLDLERQLAFLRQLLPYRFERSTMRPHGQLLAEGYGEGYGEIESLLLHAVLRRYRPRRVVEIGSGLSSVVALEALALNRREHGSVAQLTCIEPFPRPPLLRLASEGGLGLVVQQAQQLALSFFDDLGPGDVLFIDSTHVVKPGSDVPFLFLEVIPRLQPGVLVHVHDIHFPRLTPDADEWVLRRHLFWNEAPLVQAFLAFNSSFEVLTCLSWLAWRARSELALVLPDLDPARHAPSALWMRRVR